MTSHHTGSFRPLRRAAHALLALACALLLTLLPRWATADTHGQVVTPQARFWVDPSGQATLADVLRLPDQALTALASARPFEPGRGAVWLRYQPPARTGDARAYLMLEGAAFINRASLHQLGADGQWQVQHAGDHLPVSAWAHPAQLPVFELNPAPGTPVWLRLENYPAPLGASLRLVDERQLKSFHDRSLLVMGGYLGFGALVFFLGWVHVRLYGDRVFLAYVSYVACMLGFQASFTGLGGLMFWPDAARWNDMAPALFMLWLTACGIWFVREVSMLSRHSLRLHRFVTAWSIAGLLYPAVYFVFLSPTAFKILNLYGLLSVLLSMGVCIWAWRRGETHAGWTALGFLPLHLAYPFPALRSAGLIADSWLTQYAVLIGSAIEIPLLLYILHRRAKDFSENRARMRVIDSTDPLTGLTVVPVLLLRLTDALRRARRSGGTCALALVELSNHTDIVQKEGREMGDRSLVVAASQLSGLVRDVDTVCRVAETRFAVLLEMPYSADTLKLFAQHVIARGLAGVPSLPLDLAPRFRVVTLRLPDGTDTPDATGGETAEQMLARLNLVLDRLDPRKVVQHLPLPLPAGAGVAVPREIISA
jgi:GGDEF domain-containing protein